MTSSAGRGTRSRLSYKPYLCNTRSYAFSNAIHATDRPIRNQGKLMRRLLSLGALFLLCIASRIDAQVIERPVPFDSAATVMVLSPMIAERAALGPPSWPVAGDFVEARLYTVTDSSYILTVRRSTGVVERYNLSAADREAIRVSVSRLPPDVVRERNDAGNSFIRNQTLLGLAVYAPAFAYAIGENAAGAIAGYLVVAGGSFFAASEIARRNFIKIGRASCRERVEM